MPKGIPLNGDNKGWFKKGSISWIKGKHIFTGGGVKKGCIGFFKGKHHTDESKQKIRLSLKGKIAWNKGKKGMYSTSDKTKKKQRESRLRYISTHINNTTFKKGNKPANYKGGISKNKDYNKTMSRKYRILFPLRHKLYAKISKAKRYKSGRLSIKIIRQVYEDNIKQYDTLTCYLCLQSIFSEDDHLEHKTPLSRGGTNIKDNLAIAHRSCNCKKHNKTEIEYRERLKNELNRLNS